MINFCLSLFFFVIIVNCVINAAPRTIVNLFINIAICLQNDIKGFLISFTVIIITIKKGNILAQKAWSSLRRQNPAIFASSKPNLSTLCGFQFHNIITFNGFNIERFPCLIGKLFVMLANRTIKCWVTIPRDPPWFDGFKCDNRKP